MKFLIVLSSFYFLAKTASVFEKHQEEWDSFKLEYSKKYVDQSEEKCRMNIFIENKYKIDRHNRLYELGQVTFKQKMNKFGDLLHHEYVSQIIVAENNSINFTSLENLDNSPGNEFISPANFQPPKSVDWRLKGAVTHVKDQGLCGSCWSFSTTGAIEAQYFKKTGKLVSLSEQNLIDCASSYGNFGCEGGNMDYAFRYIMDNGINTEESYPYIDKDGSCRFDLNSSVTTLSGFVEIPEGDEEKLKEALAYVGPVSVTIDVLQPSFPFYHEGVYYDSQCDSRNLNHAVLVVGYGTEEDGTDYYIIKNSWGKSWGMDGYVKIARNKDNDCGVTFHPVYPEI